MTSYKVYYELDENGKYSKRTLWVQANSEACAEGFAMYQLEEQSPAGELLTCEVVAMREADQGYSRVIYPALACVTG